MRANAALHTILHSHSVQAAQKVGAANDPAEAEADRVADAVMRMPSNAAASPQAPPPAAPPAIRRKCEACAEEDTVHRRADGWAAGGPAPASVRQVLSAPGRPLDAASRAFFEPRFGHSFAPVRIHDGPAADSAAKSIHARAFAFGNDIAFAGGEYRPDSPAGRQLLAHELTHTLQQVGGAAPIRRKPSFGAGGCAPPNEMDESGNSLFAAGNAAHRQIQSFLITSGVFAELPIPRASKTDENLANPGCAPAGTQEGKADLYKYRTDLQLGEIKPIGSANTDAVDEAHHYRRRASQSLDRTLGSGPCAAQPADAADNRLATALGLSGPAARRPAARLLTGVLTTDTIIGAFDRDQDRTLKARLVAPGAVGYWCTTGRAERAPCDVPSEMDAYIDRIIDPAMNTVDQFLEEGIARAIDRMTVAGDSERLIRTGLGLAQTGIRTYAAQLLGISPTRIPALSEAEIRQASAELSSHIGTPMQAVTRVLLSRTKNILLGQIRIAIRRRLRGLIRQAFQAACAAATAGAAVTLADVLRQLKNQIRNVLHGVVEEAVLATASLVAAEVLSAIGQLLSEIGSALWRVVKAIAWVICVVALVVAVVVLAVLTVIAIIDPVPGDEVAGGAGTAFLAKLLQSLWSAGPALGSAMPALAF